VHKNRFTVLVLGNDEFAVHSCPLLFLSPEAGCDLRNLRGDSSTVGLYCITTTWQRIFTCSLQVAVVDVLLHASVERR